MALVRSLMNSGGGMFAARDGAFRYVFLDADFFKLKILQRSASQTFTEAALASGAPVVTNGQTFGSYCLLPGDCSVKWQGEIVSAHTTVSGDPPHAPSFRFFGQTDGASTDSFVGTRGDPSGATPPVSDAVGRLLPLVDGKSVSATPASTGTYWTRPATTGKTVYGIARDINAVLVLIQQNGEAGLILKDLLQLIADAGIDQAVLADGSDSSTLAR